MPKKLIKSKAPKAVTNRPVRITMDIVFEEGSRKVVPADITRAAEAGAASVRTSLTGRKPEYKIAGDIEGRVEYSYVMADREFNG